MEVKSTCDICGEGFSPDDLSNPKGVVRLNRIARSGGGYNTIVVGFGSGHGTWFVHSACLVRKAKRIGNLRGFGDAN